MTERPSLTVICHSEEETDQLGKHVASMLAPGLTVALNGQLGAGKTRFVRALCQGIGVAPAHVSSPTFVLMQLYTDGRIPIAHFDTYRLGDIDEFLAIGAEEFLHSDEWICLIEWADRVAEILPEDRLTINVSHHSETSRCFEFISSGARSVDIIGKLRSALSEGL